MNALEVQGGLLVRLVLASRSEVDRVIPSPCLRPVPAAEPSPGPFTRVQESPGWNIKMIGADKVWDEFGVKGRGIVIGQSDSGVDGAHPALAAQYRGAKEGDDYNIPAVWRMAALRVARPTPRMATVWSTFMKPSKWRWENREIQFFTSTSLPISRAPFGHRLCPASFSSPGPQTSPSDPLCRSGRPPLRPALRQEPVQ